MSKKLRQEIQVRQTELTRAAIVSGEIAILDDVVEAASKAIEKVLMANYHYRPDNEPLLTVTGEEYLRKKVLEALQVISRNLPNTEADEYYFNEANPDWTD